MDTIPSTIESANQPPDWRLVPFAVHCARCGHDLHGQTDATCPQCTLTFQWSDAVPIEKLQCGGCGYHLYGLTETRCPECGEAFKWEIALSDYYRRKPLFEFQWQTHPIGSFLRTGGLCLQPKSLWSSLKLHDPVSTIPLILFAVLTIVGSCIMAVLAIVLLLGLWVCLRTPANYLQMPGITLHEHFVEHFWILIFQMPTLLSIVCGYLFLWTIGLGCGLFIFQQSMFRRKLRPVHLARVVIYGTSVVWLGMWIAILVNFSVDRFSYIRGGIATLTLLVGCLAMSFSIRAIALACKNYLRVDHPWGVSLAAHLIALLFAVVAAIPLMPSGVGTWLLIELSRVVVQYQRAG